jgi:hypothetical protein
MPPSRSPAVFDLSPLHRPQWWVALALLLVNDHLLKGGGQVPGWLTGKLSDFAFLIVAPVLLAALVPRALPRRRGLALAAVALVYTAAEVSPAASDAIVAVMGAIGLPWRLWPDVTDLVALVVLPLTWRLMHPAAAPGPVDPPAPAPAIRPRPLLESLGVFVGAFACLATSPLPDYAHAAFVVNQTRQPREITATWLLKTVPCDGDLAVVAATLKPSDLNDPHTATLASGNVAVLGLSPPPGQLLSTQCPINERGSFSGYGNQGSCTGVIIQVSSELSVLAAFPSTWYESDSGGLCSSGDEHKSRCKSHFGLREDPGPDALSLREKDGKVVISVGLDSRVRVVEVSPAAIAARAPDAQGCRALLAEQAQATSAAGSCFADADCRTAPALPVPGQACVVYANRSLSDATISSLRSRWNSQSCVVDPNYMYNCPPPQPAVCRNERCQEACPGVQLPVCPGRCGSNNGRGTACYPGLFCATDAGDWCTCQNGTLTCAPPTKMPGCSITCLPPIDRNAPPPVDAGTRDSGPPDTRTTFDTGANTDTGADAQVDTGL